MSEQAANRGASAGADAGAGSAAKRVRRSRADIVDAALGILDEQGLPDLTMRRLGEVLGVQPSALYWHFSNKQSLLAAVSARILAPLTTVQADAATMPAAADTLATRLRDCLLSYRDGAELVSSSLALGLIEPPLHAQLAAAARALGQPEAPARTAAEAITHFTIGYAFHEQQRLQAETLGVLAGASALTPESATAASDSADDTSASAGASFAAVIQLIIAGLSATLDGAAAARPA